MRGVPRSPLAVPSTFQQRTSDRLSLGGWAKSLPVADRESSYHQSHDESFKSAQLQVTEAHVHCVDAEHAAAVTINYWNSR
jgi:hypothetical protein